MSNLPTKPEHIAKRKVLFGQLDTIVEKINLIYTSLAKQNFMLGDIIIDLYNTDMTYMEIAEKIKEYPRFKDKPVKSIMSTIVRTANGVHFLKKDFGSTFEEIENNINEKHDMQLTSNLIRGYRGSMEKYLLYTSKIPEVSKSLGDVPTVEQAQKISGLVDDFAQSNLDSPKVQQINKELIENWGHVMKEYIEINSIPEIESMEYRNFIRKNKCCHCEKNEDVGLYKLDIAELDVQESDILFIPMCGKCKQKMIEKDILELTNVDKLAMVIKYMSSFMYSLFVYSSKK